MKILIAEDDEMVADCLEEALVELGHAVCGIAGTVQDAIGLVRLHHPDVAIVDVQLAGSDVGTEIVDQLMASGELADVGILYVTGEVERLLREAPHGHACLSKPYSITALEVAIAIVRDIVRGCRSSRTVPHGVGVFPRRLNSADA